MASLLQFLYCWAERVQNTHSSSFLKLPLARSSVCSFAISSWNVPSSITGSRAFASAGHVPVALTPNGSRRNQSTSLGILKCSKRVLKFSLKHFSTSTIADREAAFSAGTLRREGKCNFLPLRSDKYTSSSD